jgi:AraC-like DNA-binding protein
MKSSRSTSSLERFPLDPGLALVFRESGAQPRNILRRAGLPDDLFNQSEVLLDAPTYFRLWHALEEETKDELLPLHVAQHYPVEAFQPALFAALCSPNFGIALERLAAHKRMLGPMRMHLTRKRSELHVEVHYVDAPEGAPEGLVLAETAFLVRLGRVGTRDRLIPRTLTLRGKKRAIHPLLEQHFGVPARFGKVDSLSFHLADIERPFVTANAAMWNIFGPALRQRMSELEADSAIAERVRAALLELIPAGRTRLPDVAMRLGMSERTLQRRIIEERTTFGDLRDQVRLELAQHYLEATTVRLNEIAFLLGFADSNSFYRAFRRWTGRTPLEVREASSLV